MLKFKHAFLTHYNHWHFGTFLWNCSHLNVTGPHSLQIKIVNCLEASRNNPLPNPKWKHPESGGPRRKIICWHQAEESDAEGGGFRRLMPASDLPTRTTRRVGVFLLYRTYLWNKQQVMSINLTTWSTMQYHVVVDHVDFYVIHSQVRYNMFYNVIYRAFVDKGICVSTCRLAVNVMT